MGGGRVTFIMPERLTQCRKPSLVSQEIHSQHLRPSSYVHPANHVICLFANHHLMLHFSLLFSSLFPHVILDAILCDIGEFHCRDRTTCVPEAWLCDGEPDCPDDSDETDIICKSAIPPVSKHAIYSCGNTALITN